jgi:hypothetical protein
MNTTLLLSLLAPLFLGLFASHAVSYYEQYHLCTERMLKNIRILDTRMCNDPLEQHHLGEKAKQMCHTAQMENLVSPASCAWKNVWNMGGLNRIWVAIQESHWLIAVVIGSVIAGFFWMWNESRKTKAIVGLQKEMFGQFAGILAQNKPKEPIYMIEEAPQPVFRKKSHARLVNV